MKELTQAQICDISGGVNSGEVAAAGLGGFGGGFALGAGIGSIGGPPGALVGGLVGGLLGTVGGVYAYFAQ